MNVEIGLLEADKGEALNRLDGLHIKSRFYRFNFPFGMFRWPAGKTSQYNLGSSYRRTSISAWLTMRNDI